MAERKNPGRGSSAGRPGKGGGGAKQSGVVHNTSRANLLDAFRDVVLNNPDVQEELRHVQDARDAVRLAAKYGFGITEEDVHRIERTSPVRLSMPELEMIAGALPCWCDPSVVDSKSCK